MEYFASVWKSMTGAGNGGTKPNKSQKPLLFLFFILYSSLPTVIPLDSFFFSLTQEQPTTPICSLPVVRIAILGNQRVVMRRIGITASTFVY